MSVRAFLRVVAALLTCLAGWGIYLLIHQWHEQKIDGLNVRQNAITGIVQIQRNGDWTTPFQPDPYAPVVTPGDLRRVRLLDATWGRNGLLTARALVAPGPPIRGRLIVTLDIIDKAWKKHVRERDLRENVDWPAGSITPFVLRTNLSAPANANQQTVLGLQPALSSSITVAEVSR